MAQAQPMKVDYIEQGTTVIVAPLGEIAYNEAPVFRTWLKKAADRKPERIVVDLAAVEYMNTPGLATLVEALQTARKTKSRLILCGLNQSVRAIFDIARLNTVFEIQPTRDAALA